MRLSDFAPVAIGYYSMTRVVMINDYSSHETAVRKPLQSGWCYQAIVETVIESANIAGPTHEF